MGLTFTRIDDKPAPAPVTFTRVEPAKPKPVTVPTQDDSLPKGGPVTFTKIDDTKKPTDPLQMSEDDYRSWFAKQSDEIQNDVQRLRAPTAAPRPGPPPTQIDADPVAKTRLGALAQPVADTAKFTAEAFKHGSYDAGEALNDMVNAKTVFGAGIAALSYLNAGLEQALSPVYGAARGVLFDPVERATGLKGVGHAGGEALFQTAQLAALPPGAKAAGTGARMVGESSVGEGTKALLSPTSAEAGNTATLYSRRPGGGYAQFTAPKAKVSEYIIRAQSGAQARAKEMTAAALQQFRDHFEQMPDGVPQPDPNTGALSADPSTRLGFINAIETGNMTGLPAESAKAAGVIRKMLDEWRDRVQGLGKGYLESAVENYFPHIWKNPPNAAFGQELDSAIARATSKQSLKGRASFLKQRTIGDTLSGMARGLEPVTTNPLDLAMVKLWEMQKFYYGNKILDEMKAAGLVKFAKARGDVPDGFVPLDGKEFKIFAPAARAEAERGGMTTELMAGDDKSARGIGPQRVGQYYAATPAARILGNYLSAGWRGQPVYDAIRHMGNTLNQAQLAWPGFHAIFVTEDTMTSELARSIESAFKGEPFNALKSLAKTPVSVIPTMRKGSAVRKAYLFPESAPPEARRLADALAAGGGRVKMDEFYRASSSSGRYVGAIQDGRFWKTIFGDSKAAWANRRGLPAAIQQTFQNLFGQARARGPVGAAWDTLKATGRGVGHVADAAAAPIMDFMVPRAKIGVFSNLAEDWMRRNPSATEFEKRAAMTDIWDSVDNRLGQMVYDNVFWTKALKDLSFMCVRSVGWNLGTIRELGGGAVDSAKAAHALMTGQDAKLTHRMAYAFSLPLIVGLQGAILNYLATGQSPQELKDYYFPRTGGITPTGAPERINLPSYVKDVVEYNESPLQTLTNKTHPAIVSAKELVENRDYYGALIHDPQDPAASQLTDWLKFFGGQVEPFSMRSYFRLEGESGSKLPDWISFFGINPAPGYITDPERGEHFQERLDQVARRRRMAEKERGQ